MSLDDVRRYGESTSDAVLDPACTLFRAPDIEGLIGYKVVSGCAIVFGDPICDQENKLKLAVAFQAFCHDNQYKTIYVSASHEFLTLSFNKVIRGAIEFGEELFIDPHDDPRKKSGPSACLVRRKIKHATSAGLVVKEYIPLDPKLEEAITAVGEEWLKNRKGVQAYISSVRLFDDRPGKRWFYALFEGQIVGTVVLNEVQKHGGWHLNHLMHTAKAPGGTPEQLIITAIEALQKENCHHLSFGTAIRPRPGLIQGFSPITTFLARWALKLATRFLPLEGRLKFWDKFEPKQAPSYLLFSHPTLHLQEIWALVKAMNIIS